MVLTRKPPQRTVPQLVLPEQPEYLVAKAHCSSPGCRGTGLKKCTGCKQARYCGQTCQLAHWKAHKADCKANQKA
jgi:hypothetical protein